MVFFEISLLLAMSYGNKRTLEKPPKRQSIAPKKEKFSNHAIGTVKSSKGDISAYSPLRWLTPCNERYT